MSAFFEVHKVVGGLPTTLERNTIYAVRVGTGFDLYVTDSSGRMAHRLNTKEIVVGGRNYILNSANDTPIVMMRKIRTTLSRINEPCVFSAYVKDTNRNSATVWLESATSTKSEQSQEVPIVNGRIVAVFNKPSDPNLTAIGITINQPNQATLYKTKLELGNVASDWMPALEDINVDLSPYATNASLDEYKNAQATKDTATAQKLSQIETAYKQADRQANTKVDNEITARTNADSALGQRIDSLQSEFNSLSVGGRNYLPNSASDRMATGNNRYIVYQANKPELTQPFVFSAFVKDVQGNNGNKLTVALADNTNYNASIEQRQDVPIVDGRIVVKFE